jgi:hypothetical protein
MLLMRGLRETHSRGGTKSYVAISKNVATHRLTQDWVIFFSSQTSRFFVFCFGVVIDINNKNEN